MRLFGFAGQSSKIQKRDEWRPRSQWVSVTQYWESNVLRRQINRRGGGAIWRRSALYRPDFNIPLLLYLLCVIEAPANWIIIKDIYGYHSLHDYTRVLESLAIQYILLPSYSVHSRVIYSVLLIPLLVALLLIIIILSQYIRILLKTCFVKGRGRIPGRSLFCRSSCFYIHTHQPT